MFKFLNPQLKLLKRNQKKEIYKFADSVINSKAFVILASCLRQDENGNDKLDHYFTISDGYKLDDLPISLVEYKKLMDDFIIMKTKLELEAKASSTSTSTTSSLLPEEEEAEKGTNKAIEDEKGEIYHIEDINA